MRLGKLIWHYKLSWTCGWGIEWGESWWECGVSTEWDLHRISVNVGWLMVDWSMISALVLQFYGLRGLSMVDFVPTQDYWCLSDTTVSSKCRLKGFYIHVDHCGILSLAGNQICFTEVEHNGSNALGSGSESHLWYSAHCVHNQQHAPGCWRRWNS